ncbi:hypothetical protein MTR67_022736 [Solanum verrucosum]|uniref:Uncharacterized protein n=1 Tax=Solanum verrucosum TaxID=315347 RepID=A0AAF0QZH8_SOLVR|nr:hypothetical protein MTR67_022736 [Solanum verrucosum]
MDRARTASPRQLRKWSSESGAPMAALTVGSSSPRHGRSSSISGMSNIKRTQNVAAKAAAQRLAQVMASQAATGNDDDEDGDDDLGFRFAAPPPPTFSRSKVSTAANSSSDSNAINPAIQSAKLNTRSSSPALATNFVEELPSLRSTSAGRPTVPSRPPPSIPSTQQPVKTPSPIPPIDPPTNKLREKRFSPDLRQVNLKDTGDHRAASALRDEFDMLQEENENLLGKVHVHQFFSSALLALRHASLNVFILNLRNSVQLRVAETSYEESEARVKELEKQVAALGEGVSLEAKLLSRQKSSTSFSYH